jgi:ABC-2 type transport system permease protein
MRQLWVLWRREVAAYIVSPVAFILAAMFLVVMGVGFWFIASVRLINGATLYDFLRALYGGVAWLGVLMVVPVLTMRSFAEETKSGTLELLLTAPVREREVVLAKFLGAFTIYLLFWLPTLAYFVLIHRSLPEGITLDTGAVASTYLGLFLTGGFALSVGTLCSALTRHTLVACMSTFALLLLWFLSGFLPAISPVPAIRAAMEPFSPVLHLLEFSRGVVDTRPVVLYVASTVLVLSLTTRVVESRRWRV